MSLASRVSSPQESRTATLLENSPKADGRRPAVPIRVLVEIAASTAAARERKNYSMFDEPRALAISR
jgi:hypothetical protein